MKENEGTGYVELSASAIAVVLAIGGVWFDI